MIRVNYIETYNFEGAIRGMRSPYNSWKRSDSVFNTNNDFSIGEADMALMQRLFKAGSEHRKFMRQIMVSMEITAPDFWWLQFDSYKVGICCNSTSKMHSLLSKPFEVDDFSVQDMPGYRAIVEQKKPHITDEMAANEKWVKVDDMYSVSNLGRIRHNDKILGGTVHRDGYIFVTLHGKNQPLHRLICHAFHPDTYEDGKVVNHIDANKQNNFASNLEWVTTKENITHSYAMHLQPVKVKTYKGKLSEEDREEIKRLYESGMSKRKIAEMFNVSDTCICDFLNGKHKFIEYDDYFMKSFIPILNILNSLRDRYLIEEDPEKKKEIWRKILAFTPLSYNQTRTVTMNYEVVANIIRQRRHHKLKEWDEFIAILLKELPYLKEIMGETDGE